MLGLRVGEASCPGPDRAGPYQRGAIYDVLASIRIQNAFVDVLLVEDGGDVSRQLPSASTDPADPTPSAEIDGPMMHVRITELLRIEVDADQLGIDASRVCCPVPSCPHHDAVRSAGWGSMASLRTHLAEHSSGRLGGDVPRDFMVANWLTLHCVQQDFVDLHREHMP